MAIKSVQTKQIKKLNFWEKLYLPEIARGLTLTFKQVFTPKFTREYPEERFAPTGSYRGRPVLVEEENGERCVACGLCSRVCPAIASKYKPVRPHVRKSGIHPSSKSTCFAASTAATARKSARKKRL